MEAKLFELFGGWVGLQKTPMRVIQRHRIRIIAEMNYAGEQAAEFKEKREEQEREIRRNMQQGQSRGRR